MQSVIFVENDYSAFERVRSSTLKSSAAGPINELETMSLSVSEPTADREPAMSRLAALFSSIPDAAVDLLLDRRPLVRAAAVKALARSNNAALMPFLWEVINDREPLVAEAAARAVAKTPDVVEKTLGHSYSGLYTRPIARVWPFMSKEKKVELLQLSLQRDCGSTRACAAG